jgi:hypothetical protein
MHYTAQISRSNPACFLFLIDQSDSMNESFAEGASGLSKAVAVADAINRLLQNLVLRSAKAGGIQDYFHVGAIGYGKTIRPGFGGKLPSELFVPISRLGEQPLRMEARTKLTPDGRGGSNEQTVKFPVWFDPQADGKTPMNEAMAAAGLAVSGFIERYREAFPPIVLNMTDGMPSDGNPQAAARAIRKMATRNGKSLVFNLLLSKELTPPICFPSDEKQLTDNCGKLLFRMSSVLPSGMWDAANSQGFALEPKARGVVINADPSSLVRFLDIGTRLTAAAL